MDKQEIPDEFICPITGQIMEDPYVVDDGHTFQRQAICQWFFTGKNTNPITNLKLQNTKIRPNYCLRGLIEKYKKNKQINSPPTSEQQIVKSANLKQKIKLLLKSIDQKQEKKQEKVSGWAAPTLPQGWSNGSQHKQQVGPWYDYDSSWAEWKNQNK